MSKKSEVVRLRKAKELAGNDGHEWGALNGPTQHSYFHAAEVVFRPKPQVSSGKKPGHQHEVPVGVVKEVKEREDGLDVVAELTPEGERKLKEVGILDDSSRGTGPDNQPPRGADTSKPKKPRKRKAVKKARKATSKVLPKSK